MGRLNPIGPDNMSDEQLGEALRAALRLPQNPELGVSPGQNANSDWSERSL